MNPKGFLDHLRVRGYSPATITSYRCELLKFQQFLHEKGLRVNQAKALQIEAYVRSRTPQFEIKPASTRWRLAVLSSFYDYLAVMSNGRVHNPVSLLRRPRRQPPRPSPLEETQVEKLTHGNDNLRNAAIIGLFLHSGLRLSELCSLERDSIRVEHFGSRATSKVVGVGRVIGKGGKEREFLVDEPTLKLIYRYLSGRGVDDESALFLSNRRQRINKRTVQHLLRAWCRRAGLPSIHPHRLRTTFASRLHKVGVPIMEISKLLAHASVDTTTIYVKPDERRIRTEYFAAQEKLNS